jgi:polysaccharide export outer membrane protein
LGEIYVQSLSLDEFKQFLYDNMNEKYVKNPQIEVTIADSPNKSVSVLGQVTKPGNYILTHGLTLLKLISQNGGFTTDADTKMVRLVRSREDGKRETIEVNMDQVIQGKAQDLPLKPGDIIFVDFQSKESKKETLVKYITVFGQIARPGNYFFSPNLTLIRLIGEAGGFTSIAATDRVKIIRHSKEGKQLSFVVNAANIMSGAKDVDVAEGDLIVVPESYF